MTVHWYSASLFYCGKREGGDHQSALWEERIIVLRAPGQVEAEKAAIAIGREKPLHYHAMDGTHITWEFRQVERCYEIESETLEHGTEVLSRFLRASEAESLLRPFDDESKAPPKP